MALLYNDREAHGDQPLAALEVAVVSLLAITHRRALRDALHALGDLLQAGIGEGGKGVQITTDLHHVVQALEDDVAMYAVRYDHRERVRSFVHDALLRLCCRDDVESTVVNAHSNGTVIATDVLRQMPPLAAAKITSLVTLGSPLRKYVELLHWGSDFFASSSTGASIPQVRNWINYYDERDPVVDPLNGLYRTIDPQVG